RTIKVWNAENGQEVRTLRTVRVWDAEKRQDVVILKGHSDPVSSVCFSPDGKRIASASGDRDNPGKPGEVKVWDAEKGVEVLNLKGHANAVSSVCFSPDGKRLASASAGFDAQRRPLPGEVKVWDAETGQEVRALKGHTGPVFSVCFSPDGKRIARKRPALR